MYNSHSLGTSFGSEMTGQFRWLRFKLGFLSCEETEVGDEGEDEMKKNCFSGLEGNPCAELQNEFHF